MSNASRPDFVGRVLAEKYTLTKRIGKGGMGKVYRARQVSTGGRVAVKVMETSSKSANSLERFRNEAQTTAQLTHPNTVRILDFGSDEDIFFLVMEYLSGTDLTRFLRVGGQSDAFVAHVLFQVASSLTEAHSRGVIHRDIKPNNIMLIHHVGHPSFVKVIDFGVARAIGGPGHGTRGLLGTIGYIAPEQAEEDSRPDARTDLYALGCVAYELLTGTLPFEGISHKSAPLDILEAHMGGRSRHILDVKPEADEELAEMIMSLIHRDPDQRPNSAGDLVVPAHSIRSRISNGIGYSVDIPPPPSGDHEHPLATNADQTFADGAMILGASFSEDAQYTEDEAGTRPEPTSNIILAAPQGIDVDGAAGPSIPPPLHATEPATPIIRSDATVPMGRDVIKSIEDQLGERTGSEKTGQKGDVESSQWDWRAPDTSSTDFRSQSDVKQASFRKLYVGAALIGVILLTVWRLI